MRFTFNTAILISVIWHVLLGSVFCIVIFPTCSTPAVFSKVNFLGPILLEDACLQVQLNQKPMFTRVQHERTIQFVKKLDADLNKIPRRKPQENFNFFEQLKYTTKIGDFIGIEKRLPGVLFGTTSGEYEPVVSEISGPAGRREVLYRPDLPPVVRWPAKMDQDLYNDIFNVKLKFYVTADGKVDFVEKLSSCGYTEIDVLAIRYMKMWQFTPVAGKSKQWGNIWLKFRQK